MRKLPLALVGAASIAFAAPALAGPVEDFHRLMDEYWAASVKNSPLLATSAVHHHLIREGLRRLLADGVDPAAKKKAQRQAIADTFSALAKEYLDTKRSSFKPKTLSKAEWLLDDWLNKYVGKIPLRQLTAGDILSVCRRIEEKGKHETAHRARALASSTSACSTSSRATEPAS